MPLSASDKEWYVKAINGFAKKNDIAVAKDEESTIVYSQELSTDEARVKLMDPEEVVHALVLQMLASDQFRYPRERLYHEKHYAHGSKGSLSDEVDIVVFDEDNLPYAIWELKSAEEADKEENDAIKNQLFGTAPLTGSPSLLVFGTIEPKGSAATPKLKIKCIDFKKYKSYQSWLEAGKPSSSEFPREYLDIDYIPYAKDSANDLNTECTQADFRALASTFHNEFFGEHPDNTIFLNLVKCLLAKIYDERTTKTTVHNGQYRFQIFVRNGKQDSATTVFNQINDLYKEAYSRYIDNNNPDGDSLSEKEFSPEQVKSVVNSLQGMSITMGAALHGDIIGAFFEEILRAGFKQDRGMYFTHDNLVRFMIEVLDLEELSHTVWQKSNHPDNRMPYVIDPACGSGTFLLHAMNTITRYVKGNKKKFANDEDAKVFYNARLSDDTPNYWAERFIYGFDPKFIMAITAKVNMVLHGDGSAHIFKDDGFRAFSKYSDPQLRIAGEAARSLTTAEYSPDMCETFDVLISNPPFGITLPQETRDNLSKTFTVKETQPSEALFIERAFQLLKPGGRLGLVLPESIFNAAELQDTRMFLYRGFWVRSIVSLPRNLFIDTPTLTSLLFAQKKTGEEIRQWDARWNVYKADVEQQVKKATTLLGTKASKEYKNPQKLHDDVEDLLAPFIGKERWVLKRGKNSELLEFSLPQGTKTVNEARDHLLKFIKTAGFQATLTRYIFEKVTSTVDYEFPVYRVSEVGYKLSKRKEKARQNQLMKFVGKKSKAVIRNLHLCDEEHLVEVNAENPANVLDYIKKADIWKK